MLWGGIGRLLRTKNNDAGVMMLLEILEPFGAVILTTPVRYFICLRILIQVIQSNI